MSLQGKKVIVLAENDYEDPELWYPYYRLLEAGAEVTIVGPRAETYTSKHGYPAQATLADIAARISAWVADHYPAALPPRGPVAEGGLSLRGQKL